MLAGSLASKHRDRFTMYGCL